MIDTSVNTDLLSLSQLDIEGAIGLNIEGARGYSLNHQSMTGSMKKAQQDSSNNNTS